MKGIDPNQPITYRHSSLRFFEQGERHVDRCCPDDVLLLVYSGTLRFTEDGVPIEVAAGEYYVQHRGGEQRGEHPSDEPQYLYVHFEGIWCEDGTAVPRRGTFDHARLWPLMQQLDHYSHNPTTRLERTAVFLQLLANLYERKRPQTAADTMAAFLETHLEEPVSLDRLAATFSFSKNHIIHLFRQAFGTTPVGYVNTRRIQKAMHLLESTSDTTEAIAERCGFHHYSHFYRLFVRQNGLAPAEWRRRQQRYPT